MKAKLMTVLFALFTRARQRRPRWQRASVQRLLPLPGSCLQVSECVKVFELEEAPQQRGPSNGAVVPRERA